MKKPYAEMGCGELAEALEGLRAEFQAYKDSGLKLNMTRGVPSNEQLALSNGMLTCLSSDDYYAENGADCRNYGGLDGIPEMKKIFAGLLELSPDEVIVSGNSSLALMFDNVASNMSHGVRDGVPWQNQGKVKFLCPCPGYDRHFTICNYFHIEMIPVGMGPDGPDMGMIEAAVAADPMVKGVWCVPKFSNPTGVVYSDETVRRFAALKPAAADFRLYWDNAYAFHELYGGDHRILNIVRLCEESGNPHMPLVFASFSKVSFAGASVTCMASSKSNCDFIKKRLTAQTIGPDKLNQLRHARFYKDAAGVLAHMEKHAEILRPKFQLVEGALRREFCCGGVAEGGGAGCGSGANGGVENSRILDVDWTAPQGGYFISFNTPDGCAKKVVALCAEAGVALTPAGATFPYGNDPRDRNIRIAPTFPSAADLAKALEVFCCAVKLVAAEKLASGSK